MKYIFSSILIIAICTGCQMGPHTYKIFETNNNFNIKKPQLKINDEYWTKEFYSKDTYIHKPIINDIHKKCNYGFLTKKDDSEQKAFDWVIISGKEYCKRQQMYAF